MNLAINHQSQFCQAQPSPNPSWAEVALVPIDPATHPPTGKVKTSLRNKSNYVCTVSTVWTVCGQCLDIVQIVWGQFMKGVGSNHRKN